MNTYLKYILLLSLVVFVACKNSTKEDPTETNTEISSETEISATQLDTTINVEVEDEEEGGLMLLGPVNRKGLTSGEYKEWFDENFDAHTLKTELIDSLAPLLNDTKITVFMGSWCEDSQREVPAMYKILDAVDYDFSKLDLIALSHDKETPNHLEKGHNIEYVPTIIFIRGADTLNRIVEYAHQTLESDMLTILKGLPYKPAYAE